MVFSSLLLDICAVDFAEGVSVSVYFSDENTRNQNSKARVIAKVHTSPLWLGPISTRCSQPTIRITKIDAS